MIPGKPPSEDIQIKTIEDIDFYLSQENTEILFFDPFHLLYNVVNARMWQPKGKSNTIILKSNPGRKRINILGALNFNELSVITELTEETCNAERVVYFIKRIREQYKNKNLVIVLDNARYNHAKIVRAFAEVNNIELFFLPPYTPNLNLIERIWRFTKKKLVHNTYYDEFNDFFNATTAFFDNLDVHDEELSTLVTNNFEIIHAV